MAEIDEKLSEMTQRTGTLTSSDLLYICIADVLSDTGFSSRKDTISNFFSGVFGDIEFPLLLNTTAKSIFGAINELAAASGGATVLTGTVAPTSEQGSNGSLYVQYTQGTGGASDTVDAIYVKLDDEWCEISVGGGTSGTTLTDTLEAGETSITFTSAAITTNSKIEVLTSDITVRPTGATVTTGSLTLTFTSQASDITVSVEVY